MAKAPTSRPKRVSLKGKGADIFFGDYAPAEQTVEQLPPSQTDELVEATGEHSSPEASVSPDQDRGVPAVEPAEAFLQASKQASMEERTQASTLAPLRPRKIRRRNVGEGDRQDADDGVPAGTENETTQHGRSPLASVVADSPAGRRSQRPTSAPTPTSGGDLLDEVAPAVWEHLDIQATITNAFRYTDEELSALADVLYQISKTQRARVTKQDVARLGLNVVLDDYRRRGTNSLLGQLASRRKSPRRSGGG